MPYCSDCGEQVGSDVRFCPNCGAEMHGWQDETTPDGPTGQGDQPAQGGHSQGGHSHGGGQPRGGQDQGGRHSGGEPQPGSRGGNQAGSPDTHAGTEAAARAAGTDPAAAATQVQKSEPGPTTNPEGPMPFENGAFGHAFGYPKQDDYDPVLIGAIIEFVGSFVPFVNFIVRGYGLRLARASARGQVERPEWGDYGGQFVDGLKLLALGLAFGLVWLLVGGVLGGATFLVSETAGVVVFGLVMFVASLLFPASLVTYAATDSFTAAFSPTQAGAFLTSLSYVKAYVLASLLSVVYLIVLFISVFTIVGVFVVAAYGTYFFASFWGYYYREAVEAGSAPPAPAEPVAAD